MGLFAAVYLGVRFVIIPYVLKAAFTDIAAFESKCVVCTTA